MEFVLWSRFAYFVSGSLWLIWPVLVGFDILYESLKLMLWLRWCIGIRSNLNIWPQTECLSHENE